MVLKEKAAQESFWNLRRVQEYLNIKKCNLSYTRQQVSSLSKFISFSRIYSDYANIQQLLDDFSILYVS